MRFDILLFHSYLIIVNGYVIIVMVKNNKNLKEIQRDGLTKKPDLERDPVFYNNKVCKRLTALPEDEAAEHR